MTRLLASRWIAGWFVAFLLLLLCLPLSHHVVEAFDKTWVLADCTNVSNSDVGLWDDAPGAGRNNESAFFWLETHSNADEACTYASIVAGADSTSLKLSVRAAVNDGAKLTVALRQPLRLADGALDIYRCEGTFIASVVIHGNSFFAFNQPFVKHDDSQSEFVTEWVALPPGVPIGDVCLTLDDTPSGVASERASALIDYIKISQSLAPPPPICVDPPCLTYLDTTLVWQETFQRAK